MGRLQGIFADDSPRTSFASHNAVSGQLDFSLRAQGCLRIPLIAWHEHLLLKLSAGSKKSNLDGIGSYTQQFAGFFGRMLTDVAEQDGRPHGAGETNQELREGRD
jgi:hypothetical protein